MEDDQGLVKEVNKDYKIEDEESYSLEDSSDKLPDIHAHSNSVYFKLI